jgi:hypothetical protein
MTSGGVLIVKFEGLLVAAGLSGLKARIVASMRGEPIAVLADYSRCVLAVSGRELDNMMVGRSPNDLPHLPAAVVIGESALLPAMRRAAMAAGMSHGVRRVVMLDQRQGLDWVQSQIRPRS